MSGWIKLHRSLLKWEWYDDINVSRLFITLLLHANYEPSTWRGFKIMPGQIVTGLYRLSEQSGLTVQQIRTALNKLKSTNEITIKPTNKYSIISIANWCEYQSLDDEVTNNPTNEQQTNNKQSTTSKELKEVKEDIKGQLNLIEEPKVKKSTRGTRIPADWEPNEKNIEFATSKGFMNGAIQLIAEGFKDHWIAATGKGSTARDWDAKWRTWVNNKIKWDGPPKAGRDKF